MALTFLGVPTVFTISSFEFMNQIAVTLLPVMSCPNSLDLSPLDHQTMSYHKLQPKPETNE